MRSAQQDMNLGPRVPFSFSRINEVIYYGGKHAPRAS